VISQMQQGPGKESSTDGGPWLPGAGRHPFQPESRPYGQELLGTGWLIQAGWLLADS